MPGGRPSKLTPELQAAIVASVSEGKPLVATCEAEGLDDSTIRKWRGQVLRGQAEPQVVEFITALTRARAVGQLVLIDRVLAGDGQGESNGRAKGAQWLLERLWPNTYAPRLNVKLEEGMEILVGKVERVCGAKDCGCYDEILAALDPGGDSPGEDLGEESGEARVH